MAGWIYLGKLLGFDFSGILGIITDLFVLSPPSPADHTAHDQINWQDNDEQDWQDGDDEVGGNSERTCMPLIKAWMASLIMPTGSHPPVVIG